MRKRRQILISRSQHGDSVSRSAHNGNVVGTRASTHQQHVQKVTVSRLSVKHESSNFGFSKNLRPRIDVVNISYR